MLSSHATALVGEPVQKQQRRPRADLMRLTALGLLGNVPLPDAHVFEQHPGRVGQPRRFLAADIGRDICDHILELGMRSTASEEIDYVLAQSFVSVFFHRGSLLSISYARDVPGICPAPGSDFSP